ncbi:MAG: signal peptidase I [Ruminococcus flavefaciens]|nr:signal peptidase I [Ruminococcus flavefaciens]MCM1229762.1 signal peptidase I [Ruminococcus flavefaciens]
MERLKKLAEFIETLITAFFVATLISAYVFRPFSINGDSMRSTLDSGDKVIVGLLSFSHKQGDIVMIRAEHSVILGDDGSPDISEGIDKTIVKRIIATGGQTVDIDFGTGAVYVDGERIFEKYLRLGLTHKDEGAFDYPVTVPEGYVFVMGDYRSVSLDSRSPEIGFIPEKDILGEVLIRISPFDKFGTLE